MSNIKKGYCLISKFNLWIAKEFNSDKDYADFTLKIMDKDKFIENFYGDKKLVHLQILEMVKIGIVEKEHACLHGNLNFYKKNINKA